ncbi:MULTISPECIES: hypothetical protein [Eubacterium]|uniref:DUF5640 domain-containing protein n=1 Tax=Eubacterium barkeri TaxID=1528 RepID=A0A1H3CDR6_EUBBA|nr:hypothetical protein [Eubacterium barkeri]SDX51649.1 hypothetical protein SAMN04488579_10342 [Eubacterium barkeri]
MKRKVLFVGVVLVAVLALCACGKNDSENIIGKWMSTEDKRDYVEFINETECNLLRFNGFYQDFGGTIISRYELLENNKISFKDNFGQILTYKYKLEGDTLTLIRTVDSGYSETFVFTKTEE